MCTRFESTDKQKNSPENCFNHCFFNSSSWRASASGFFPATACRPITTDDQCNEEVIYHFGFFFATALVLPQLTSLRPLIDLWSTQKQKYWSHFFFFFFFFFAFIFFFLSKCNKSASSRAEISGDDDGRTLTTSFFPMKNEVFFYNEAAAHY